MDDYYDAGFWDSFSTPDETPNTDATGNSADTSGDVVQMDPFVVSTNMSDTDLSTDFNVDTSGASPLNTTDETTSGGFLDDLGNLFTDAFKSITGAAIGAGTAAANAGISKAAGGSNSSTNKTTNTSTVQNFVQQNGMLLIVGAALVAFAIYANRNR